MLWFYDGNIQRLTESGFMEKPPIEPATPGLRNIGLSPTSGRLLVGHFFVAFPKLIFCGFSMGSNEYWAGRVYDLCVFL